MSDLQSPQPGQWWVMDVPAESLHKGCIVFFPGRNAKGHLLFEDCDGNVEADTDCEEDMKQGWSRWHHEPACTGFDWKPETFPQWWTTLDSPTSTIAFIKRYSETVWATVKKDGTEIEMKQCGDLSLDRRKKLTEAEALALLTPRESPEDWVTQDLVPERAGIDEWRMVSGANASVWIRSATSQSCQNRHGDKVGDSICEVRCRRKDLPRTPDPVIVESTDNFIELTDPDEVLQPDDEVTAIENISDADDRNVALQCPLDDGRYGWCTVESLRGLTGAKVRNKRDIFVMRRPVRHKEAKPAMEKITLATIIFWDEIHSLNVDTVAAIDISKEVRSIKEVWKHCHVVKTEVVEVPVA